MTILVTGGAGYIGSHTCKALSKAGFSPIAYDNLSTGHATAVKWGPLVKGDINDKTKLIETIETYKPLAVLHFAADALVVESIEKPWKYYRNNVAGTLSLLEAMRETKLNNIIFSSSCATYGLPEQTPMKEDHPQRPISPYGRSKLMSEQMIIDFGFNSVLLRYFNAAGADLEGEAGEKHDPETHIIPNVILSALGHKKEIVVYGTDFPTPDGSAVRDYIHVQDLADAHVLALQHLLNGGKSNIFNLGTGSGTSVLAIIDAVRKHGQKEIPVRLEGRRAGEPAILTADSAKARAELGWTPKRSAKIIESAWNWHAT